MKLGIALSGGGAKGFAHIGVLSVLQNAGIEFSAVSGTSMGAFVGAFYAADKLGDLQQGAVGIKLRDIPLLLSPTLSKKGFMSGKKIIKFLKESLEKKNIGELNKKYAAVCVDLNNGEVVTFTDGDLISAVRASIAIPGLFIPVVFNNRLLVDGGILEPLPVRAVRELGSDFVVGVDVITGSIDHSIVHKKKNNSDSMSVNSGFNSIFEIIKSFAKGDKNKLMDEKNIKYVFDKLSVVSILKRSILLNQKQLISHVLERFPVDFLITPDLTGVGVSDFHRAEHIIEIGKDEAEKIKRELKDIISKVHLKKSFSSSEN
ncbi:MAG TPA: patatin-like phospholipase family protein [Thermodesulfobacteriota bacterium]|jgi:NTE family protein